MKCPKCGGEMRVDVEITGGCRCDPEEQYCYCDSQDVHIDFCCNGYSKTSHRRCSNKIRVIHDQYALERFFKEHYKP